MPAGIQPLKIAAKGPPTAQLGYPGRPLGLCSSHRACASFPPCHARPLPCPSAFTYPHPQRTSPTIDGHCYRGVATTLLLAYLHSHYIQGYAQAGRSPILSSTLIPASKPLGLALFHNRDSLPARVTASVALFLNRSRAHCGQQHHEVILRPSSHHNKVGRVCRRIRTPWRGGMTRRACPVEGGRLCVTHLPDAATPLSI